ncbi:hypothetical protein Hanom_Chr07g00635641 [Helianthus anomalus]
MPNTMVHELTHESPKPPSGRRTLDNLTIGPVLRVITKAMLDHK